MNSLLTKSFQYAFKNSIPLMATIELTQDCNLRCRHCYNFDRITKTKNDLASGEQLKKEEFLSVISQLADLGTLFVNFSGGESSLSPYLLDYIKACRDHHMEARLKTNGTRLDKKSLIDFKEAGIAGMDISLYGFSDQTYKYFTQKDQDIEKLKANILYAKELGLEVIISIILHRNNVDELPLMVEFCHNNQIKFNIGIEMTKRYDDTDSSLAEGITSEQFRSLLQGPYAQYFEHENSGKNLQCSCARSVIGVASNGDIYPCIGAPLKVGNIKENTLFDIWNNSQDLKKIRSLNNDDFKSCKTCEYIENCNRSSGSIYANTKNYTGCDEKTLEQAKIRAELTRDKHS